MAGSCDGMRTSPEKMRLPQRQHRVNQLCSGLLEIRSRTRPSFAKAFRNRSQFGEGIDKNGPKVVRELAVLGYNGAGAGRRCYCRVRRTARASSIERARAPQKTIGILAGRVSLWLRPPFSGVLLNKRGCGGSISSLIAKRGVILIHFRQAR